MYVICFIKRNNANLSSYTNLGFGVQIVCSYFYFDLKLKSVPFLIKDKGKKEYTCRTPREEDYQKKRKLRILGLYRNKH